MAIPIENLERPVLVYGRTHGVHTAARVILHLALFATVIAAVLMLIAPAWILLPLTTSIAIELLLFRRRSRRVWITDVGHGFRIETRRGARDFDDDDVFSLKDDVSDVYIQGRYKGQRRRVVLHVASEDRPIKMDYRIRADQFDPLAAFIARVLGKYVARAKEALQAGAVVRGDSWSLSATEFTCKRRGAAESVPLDDLVAVEMVDGHVQCWKRGLDEAFFRIPTRSQHSTLILHLLAEYVQHRASEETSTQGLGRVIFERRTSRILLVVLWVFAVVCAAIGTMGFIGSLKEPELWIMGGIFSLVTTIVSMFAFSLGRSRFRCHQFGVFHKALFTKARQLFYHEVDEFTYVAIRQHHNGIYVGTSLQLTFKPPAGSDKMRIRYSTMATGNDPALENLRNHIAVAIGTRMLEQLNSGEQVEWTKTASITPTGIEARRASLVGRKDPLFVPFEQIQGFDIQEGVFHLWQTGTHKSVVQINTLLPNFYPGYWALCQFLVAQSNPAGAAQRDETDAQYS